MIDTYLLEQLTAVYECGTLSAASEKLHLTQPTLTRSMQKLEDDSLSCHPCGSERLLFAVPPEHRIAGMKECSFKDMDGESFLMASEVGYWDHIVRQQMPNAHFLLQNGLEALHEIVRASSLPHFATDLTLRLYGCNPQRAYVPISDDAAVEHFFCYCRRGDEKRFLAWFQALERRFQ